MKNLFSIVLILSCVNVQAEEITKELTHEVAFTDDITAFAKEIPGKVYVHKVTRGSLKLELAKENGYDAVILEKDDTTLEMAKEAGFHVDILKKSIDGKEYAIILFDTDAKEDIIDYLAA
jgi:hypothetical protein